MFDCSPQLFDLIAMRAKAREEAILYAADGNEIVDISLSFEPQRVITLAWQMDYDRFAPALKVALTEGLITPEEAGMDQNYANYYGFRYLDQRPSPVIKLG